MSTQNLWPQISAQLGLEAHAENRVHPHHWSERAELFHAADGESTEWEYLNLLHALVLASKPATVLELGTGRGYGSLAIASAIHFNKVGHLVSVDVGDAQVAKQLCAQCGFQEVVTFSQSRGMDFLEKVNGSRFDFVFIDSGMEERWAEFERLISQSALSDGAIVAFHDTSARRANVPVDPRYWPNIARLPYAVHFQLSRGFSVAMPRGIRNVGDVGASQANALANSSAPSSETAPRNGLVFRHSGDLGDIIYSLPSVRALGGGTFLVDAHRPLPWKSTLGEAKARAIAELLTTQPYIHSAGVYDGRPIDCDLDVFRKQVTVVDKIHLAITHWMSMGLPLDRFDVSGGWLCIQPRPVAEIVVCNSMRRRGDLEWELLRPYLERCVFLGLEEEHAEFSRTYSLPIRFHGVRSLCEFAEIVAGARLLVANPTFGFALAEALNIPRVLEAYLIAPNALPLSSNGHVTLTREIIERYVGSGSDNTGQATCPIVQSKLNRLEERSNSQPTFAETPGQSVATKALRSLLSELERSQWSSCEEIHCAQFVQLAKMVSYAALNVPFYRERLRDIPTEPEALKKAWKQLPVISRQEVQLAGSSLHAALPSDAEPPGLVASSGSTGRPLAALATSTTQLFWNAFTLRDHFWHRRNFGASLAAIRSMSERPTLSGCQDDNWGEPTRGLLETGKCSMLDVRCTIEEQAEWLRHVDPNYLLTHPSIAESLAEYFLKNAFSLPRLKQVRTFGEVLDRDVRDLCRRAWDASVVDAYSAAEVGYIALQCPDSLHYHVQSEGVFVEVLDDQNEPCQLGEIGRVVITTLVNYAMPLIRYEIGDYAEVGGPCRCGRGLPVLNRILGRKRNVCLLPDGSHRWPSLSTEGLADKVASFPPIQQFQLTQKSLSNVELSLVMHRPLSDEEEGLVRGWVTEALGYPFKLVIRYAEKIPRGPSGKFEDFRCEIDETSKSRSRGRRPGPRSSLAADCSSSNRTKGKRRNANSGRRTKR